MTFFSKCEQICRKQQTWSHLLKKPLMENFVFCTVCAAFKNMQMNMYFVIFLEQRQARNHQKF